MHSSNETGQLNQKSLELDGNFHLPKSTLLKMDWAGLAVKLLTEWEAHLDWYFEASKHYREPEIDIS